MSTSTRAVTGFLTAAVVLGGFAAAAQTRDRADRPGERRGQQRIEDIRVAVWTPQEHSETALLRDGETLRLERGQRVILRVVAPDKTNPGLAERIYLAARYSLERGEDRIALSGADIQKGWIELAARDGGYDRRGPAVVRWELAEKVQLKGAELERGAIRVEVEAGPVREAEAAVTELYRGILLREPDAGARSWVERVSRGGYEELLEAAKAIAESRESEIDLYTRGACNQQRLLALHRHLLGVQSDALDQRRWRAELDRMGRGDISGVVLDIVRSTQYRERHDWSRRYGVTPPSSRR